MNILVVAHYQGDGSPTAIFVHHQIKVYCNLGHNVRVLSPVAIGKNVLAINSRLKGGGQLFNDISHYYLRYISLSSCGEKHFNTISAIASLKLQLHAVLKDFCPDIIHAHTLGFDSEIGKWLKKRFNVPLVVTTHGSDTSIPYEQRNMDFLRTCSDGVDHIVAVSSVLGNKLRECGTGTPITSVLNGYAVQNCPAEEEKKNLSILQVGHLQTQKRPAITIQAFAKIHSIYPNARLTMIGTGPERERLETLCEELGIRDVVRFTGQLSNQEVLLEMAQTQFFVMPSVREGLGIVYLEAMASGCITIGTEGEGISDVIVSGKNGYLVPADDPDAIVQIIKWCISNPEKAEHIAKQGYQDAHGLTWENNANKYIELFEGMIS